MPGEGAVIAELAGDAELLRAVAASSSPRGATHCSPRPTTAATTVVLSRAPGSPLDCGALWKQLAARHGGRGGGRTEQAQGRLATRVTDWPALVSELLGSKST